MSSRVVETWIEEVIEFDTTPEMEKYRDSIRNNPKYQITKMTDLLVGDIWKVRLTVRHRR